ncbi:MAG TPA: glycosyltransferase [Verrucomicrobiae bacterium]|nr:glycosyltransferase [Verrucomicrobiae bacterium]
MIKRALIATVYNEADNLSRWWECLMRQTVLPEEIVIVDGGSKDGTWEQLQKLAATSHTKVKVDQHRCNIAEGRNRAIALTDAEIIAATDAGSFPEPAWFDEITRPLLEDQTIDVTGGLNVCDTAAGFQKFLTQFEAAQETGVSQDEINPSSRNTAYRRQAWSDVGGYPEWLTLAAEDLLFTQQLNRIRKKIVFNPRAVVHWSVRDTEKAYFKLLYRNAYGAAEAQSCWPDFRRRIILSLCPPLLLLSRHRFRHLRFRYLRNFYGAYGWVAGKLSGRRPPPGWQQIAGMLLSPQTQKHLLAQKRT